MFPTKGYRPWENSTLSHFAYCKMPHQNMKKFFKTTNLCLKKSIT